MFDENKISWFCDAVADTVSTRLLTNQFPWKTDDIDNTYNELFVPRHIVELVDQLRVVAPRMIERYQSVYISVEHNGVRYRVFYEAARANKIVHTDGTVRVQPEYERDERYISLCEWAALEHTLHTENKRVCETAREVLHAVTTPAAIAGTWPALASVIANADFGLAYNRHSRSADTAAKKIGSITRKVVANLPADLVARIDWADSRLAQAIMLKGVVLPKRVVPTVARHG